MTRHASVHAAGVVIAPRPLTEYVPLYKGARDEIVTQWAMKEVERIGLLKMDFLGLSTLTLLDDAVKEIKRTEGVDIDLDDAAAGRREDLRAVQRWRRPAGIFQFESSSGMRETLRKAKPQRLDDLIALNALYRPGPLRAGVVDDYIERKHGQRRDQVRSAADGADPERHLRRHRLSGTGDAHRARPRRLHAWAKPTCCARRWARRTPKSCRRSARAS